MTKSTITTLTFGFLALALSALPVTPVQGEVSNDCSVRGGATVRGVGIPLRCGSLCEAGESQVKVYSTEGTCPKVLCCKLTTPSEPYATGESGAEREARETRECAAMGGRYNPQGTPRCIKRPVHNIGKAKTTDDTPAALKPVRACRAKGPEYEYDVQAGVCVQKAEEPRKKKKKRKRHDDVDDDDD